MVTMSNTTVLNVKIDKELKKQAQSVAKDLGLPVSTMVASLLKKVITEREITFSAAPKLKSEVEKEVIEFSKSVDNGTADLVGPFDSVEDFLADLRS
jgi:addiction module RelB/DinJ family antitoxin